MGIARVFLGCAKAAPVGRGHEHPRARNGPELGDGGFARHHQRVSPALGRMFMAHLHRWALAFLGFRVRRLLRESPQATRRRQPVTRHRVAGSREIRLPQNSGRVRPAARPPRWVPACAKDTCEPKAVDKSGASLQARFAESTSEMLRVQCRFGARVGPGGFRCAVLSRLSSSPAR